ncbi:hypothetical protein FRC02_012221 [Tulasnella sp. 418]|nr:hypothetical protein FRC02_012221 [Tulasnella sp. 418]
MTLVPFPDSVKPPPTANVTVLLHLKRLTSLEWALNHDPFAAFLEEEDPLLFSPGEMKNLDPDLVPTYPVGSVVDVVLISDIGNPRHPIHKHGTKAFVLAQAEGEFPWSTVAEAQKARPEVFNLVNPPYRDGFHTLDAVTKPAFIVIRYLVTEPSVTFFHCHINIHTFGGMAVALMEGPEAVAGLQMPDYYIKWNEEAKAKEAAHKKRTMSGRSPSFLARLHRHAHGHHH